METFYIEKELKTFGFQVKDFPEGIGKAFDRLINETGDRAGDRNYFGISECINGEIKYFALAEEKLPDEAAKLKHDTLVIESGNYLVKTVRNWRNKTNTINAVFAEMMQDENANNYKPAIEWYKDDDEMWCLLKIK